MLRFYVYIRFLHAHEHEAMFSVFPQVAISYYDVSGASVLHLPADLTSFW